MSALFGIVVLMTPFFQVVGAADIQGLIGAFEDVGIVVWHRTLSFIIKLFLFSLVFY